MARRARGRGEVDGGDDDYDDKADDAAAANVASLLLKRELFGGSGRRASRDRRAAAAAASTAASRHSSFLPPPTASTTDPSAAALVWAEAALLRRARSRYLDLPVAIGRPTRPAATIAARFSGDGALLACSHGDHAVRVSCGETGRALCVLQGHARTPWCVAWHPHRADTLASGSLDGAVLVWRLDRPPPPPGEGDLGRSAAAGLGDGFGGMPSPPRLAMQRRARGGETEGRTGAEDGSSPPRHHHRHQPPSRPPPLTPRLIARHDFRRPVASLAFAPSGDVLAVQAGRRMFTWRYGAEASPAASPRGGGGLPPLLPSPGSPVAAAVSSAAAAAATAPVEIYRARNTLRMVAPHPAAGVPLLLTAEVMPGATGGSGAGAAAIAVSLRDLPEALAPEVAARMCAEGRRVQRWGGAAASSSASTAAAAAAPSRGRGDDNDDGARGPRAAAVAAALEILRLRLAETAGPAAAAANYGGGMPPYLLSELMGAASEAWARAGGGGQGGLGGDADNGHEEERRNDPSSLMRDQAWASRVRQWASRRADEQLREEEREAWGEGTALDAARLAARAAVARAAELAGVADLAGILASPAAPLSPRPPRSPDLERLPSTAGPGLVAALPASTRTFSPEWLLPSSSSSAPPSMPRPGAAVVAAAADAAAPAQPAGPPLPVPPAPPPQHQQQHPLYGPHHPPLVTTGELPGYRRYWASDEAGSDRAVHLGGARPSAREGAAAAAAAAAPALAAAAEAFRETALAACQGSQALPCLATLRLWRWEEGDGSEGGGGGGGGGGGDWAGTTDDDGAAPARPPPAAAPVRRPAPASLRPPRLLKIPCAVLCSEVSASISPCGRTLAAVVACRPAGLRPGHPLLAQLAEQGGTGGLEHAVYELRVYSIELTPAAAPAGKDKAGAKGAGTAAAAAAPPPPLLGRLLRARAVPAAHCLTTVQHSPTGAHLMLAYGRRHISLCSLAAASGNTDEVVPVHSVVEFYRADDLSLARVLPSLSDEVNAAAWRGGSSGVWGGGGAGAPPAVAYGTKEGRVRLIELG